jgi:broad specificity phosphatase PhoE
MTTIYLIRHGEVYNPSKILYGRLPNFGLSETGKKQTEESAEFLKDKQISALYSSPLLRAKETAEIIKGKIDLPKLFITDEITEVLTSYQEQKTSNLDLLQSEVYLKPLSQNDETIEQIATRMRKFTTGMLEMYKGKNIAVVSHGDPIMILKAYIQNKELTVNVFKTNTYVKHAEIYQIDADDNNKLSIKSIFTPQA